jgi:beta-xylosidase
MNLPAKCSVGILAAVIALTGCVSSLGKSRLSVRGWTPDNGDGTFTNPLMWGDWPDPDVIRVGDDFYFVSTSMHYVPGCPIAKSKDLVNWEMAGYAVPRFDEDPRYDFKGGNRYVNGSWAATIRHQNGLFYAGFCTPNGNGGADKHGHFSICTATNVSGPWTRTIFPEYLYDPGLLFDDDGRVYVVHGQDTLYVTELNSDARSVKVPAKKIFHFDDYPYLEGSHAYKINGKYYVLATTGGQHGREICLRADTIYGPYEHKVVLQDDSTYSGSFLHQGGLVQLKNGDWWFVIMQDRGPIGRVPNLEPVTWIDGWPVPGKDGKGVVTCKKPDVGCSHPIAVPATSDEFNSPTPGLQWQWNHNPDNANWSLTERPGWLRLKAGKAHDLKDARNTLTQRVQGPVSEGVVEMDVSGLKDGDVAGLGVFQFPSAYVAVRQDGVERQIIMVNDGKIIASTAPFAGNKIWFKAQAGHVGFTASFYYSTDGKRFTPFGDVLKMELGLPWTANRFALFNYSAGDAGVGGHADFNYFHFRAI